MKLRVLPLALLSALSIACSDDGDGNPFVLQPQLDFQIVVPAELAVKGVVDVEMRILVARNVEYPLEVTFEKANVGEPFVALAPVQIIGSASTNSVSIGPVPVYEDPTFRVTVTESSAQRISVSKLVTVNVLEFP